MVATTSLADQIMQRSDAAIQIKYLQHIFAEEQKKRKSFREWITADIKAEFINGEIIVHSPVMKRHWKANDLLSRLLSVYVDENNLGEIGTEKVMIALSRNDYEPDIVFFSKKKAAQFTDTQVIFPIPDFVVEILSKSTAKNDRTIKKDDYALHQIPEYWIIDPEKQKIEQYILSPNSKKYFPAKIHQSSSYIKSTVIKDFEIPVLAIFNKDLNKKILKGFLK